MPLTPSAVSNESERLSKAAARPHMMFHDLRHTVASALPSHSVPVLVVSKTLGHSSPSIIRGIYAPATLDMQDQAASVMEEIVAPVAGELPHVQPSAINCSRETDPLASRSTNEPKRNRNTAFQRRF